MLAATDVAFARPLRTPRQHHTIFNAPSARRENGHGKSKSASYANAHAAPHKPNQIKPNAASRARANRSDRITLHGEQMDASETG